MLGQWHNEQAQGGKSSDVSVKKVEAQDMYV
jgi:hypothetical protein